MKGEPVVVGNLSYSFADGTPLFTHLKFSLTPGRHALVGPDENSLSILCQLLSDKLRPTEGSIAHNLTRELYFPPPKLVDAASTIASELGYGQAVSAARAIRNGKTDTSLFEVLAENWDAEDRCYNALNSFGLRVADLLEPVSALDPDDLVRVRLAAIQLQKPELVIWEDPSAKVSSAGLILLNEFLKTYQGSVVIRTSDPRLLGNVDHIWKLTSSTIKHYPGAYDDYFQAQQEELKAAAAELGRAQYELELRLKETGQAQTKRLVRRERNQRFSDPGLPRKHRGNMKRKSQESLAKAKANDEQKVEVAESKVERAKRLFEELEETADRVLN